MGAQEREVYMSTHKPPSIEECLQLIQEALEQIRQIREALEEKPDHNVVEKWLSKVLVKLGEIHEDVRDLQQDLAYVTSQVDELQS